MVPRGARHYVLLALVASVGAQEQDRAAAPDRAYGERRSRLSDEYWERQRRLERELEQARARLDEALARWNALR